MGMREQAVTASSAHSVFPESPDNLAGKKMQN
jgi:hypothetical protein